MRALVVVSILSLATDGIPLFAQRIEDLENSTQPGAHSSAWPGAGVMVAGELWDSSTKPVSR
jgi:hypothetical protein